MKRITKVILLLFLTIQFHSFLQFTPVSADVIDLNNPSLEMEVNVYVADANMDSGYRMIIKNGVSVDTNPQEIVLGTRVMFEVQWALDKPSQFNDGDTINITIPENFFFFDYTDRPYDIVVTGSREVLGEFSVTPGNGVTIELNGDAITKAKLEEGSIRFTGIASKLTSVDNKVEILGTELPLIIKEVIQPLVGAGDSLDNLYKKGKQIGGSSVVEWEVLMNIKEYSEAFETGTLNQMKNMILIEELGKYQTIGHDYSYDALSKQISITMPTYIATENGELSNYLMASLEIDFGADPFILTSNSNAYPLLESFVEEIKNHPESYIWGIYERGPEREQVLVIKLPDMDTVSVKGPRNTAMDLLHNINDMFVLQNEKTKTYVQYLELGRANGGTLPVLAYRLVLTVDITDLSVTWVSNDAELRYGENESLEATIQINYDKYDGAVKARMHAMLDIVAVDGDTNEMITDAIFKLQRYDDILGFIDYVPADGKTLERASVDGYVEFDAIVAGTYRVIEVRTATGYDANRIVFASASEFTITGYESSVIEVIVENYKLKQIVQPSKTIEPPKTGVENSMVYQIIMLGVATLLVILNSRKDSKKANYR
jgi:Predicted outer membrane protein